MARGSAQDGSNSARWSRRLQDLLASGHAESMVSMALTLPILLSFVFGLMQVCLGYYTYARISEVAREATRYAVVHGSTCVTSAGVSCTITADDVQSYAAGVGYPDLGGGTMSVRATYPDGDEAPNHRVLVTVTYTFPYNIPWVLSRSLSISSSSERYIVL